MAVIKCKMCGGDLVLIEGQSVAECEYCGSRQTVPMADNEKKLIQFERAERLRRNCEFDKAAGLYEAIVSEFRQEAEAYWGLVLCKYGIEYVDDPATGKKIPTCHRSSFHSILEDSDFEQTMENADEVSLRVYREEAKQIERIRRRILEVSSNEKPYDIFICYKENDVQGNRTVDSLLAQSIYDALTEKGYRVFFSRISLEDKLGQAYEPYIFAALNSAKIMLAVGTCYENYNAVWVKNEWSRYLKIIAQDKGKYLIPCYKNIDAYDIPREFAHLQGQDMGKVGAMADLLRGIEKLLPRHTEKSAVIQERVVSSGEQTAPLLRRAKLFLEDRDWDSADKYCEKVLDMEPENGEAWFCKLMAECKVSTEEELRKQDNGFISSPNCQKALRFGSDAVQEKLENARKDTVYYAAKRKAAQNDKGAQNKDVYRAAIEQLGTIPGWRDSGKLISEYRIQIANIEAREAADRQEKERQAQLARERAEKKGKQTKKLVKMAVPVISAAVALMIVLNTILPMLQGSGKPETTGVAEAEVQLSPVQTQPPMQEATDPQAQAYAAAEQLLADGETAKAAIAFGKLGDCADARQRSFELWNQLFHKDSIFHINGTFYGLKNDGSIVTAGKDEFAIAGNPEWENTVQLVGGSRYDWNQENACLLGLRSDGTVITAGQNEAGQCDVSDWTDIVHLWHEGTRFFENTRNESGLMQRKYLNYLGYTIGLRTDGTVCVAGGQDGMPDVSGWRDVVDIQVGAYVNHNTRTLECRYLVGLRSDGRLLIAGDSVPELLKEAENWTEIVDIEVSDTVITALRPDGTVMVALDETAEYYRKYPDMHEAIREWKDVAVLLTPTSALSKDGDYLSMDSVEAANIYNDSRVAIRAGWDNIVSVVRTDIALKADGTVTVAAFSDNPSSKVQDWTDVAAVCGATSNYGGHTIGIRKDGSVLAVGDTEYIKEVAAWTNIKIPD